MSFLAQAFTWWNGQTLGTRFHTWRNGTLVGEDGNGNAFYQSGDGSRRWVIFKGESEASKVAPEWHGWLHHTWQDPPTAAPVKHKAWEKPHLANMTGSDDAYRPPGSILKAQPRTVQDYEPWTPG